MNQFWSRHLDKGSLDRVTVCGPSDVLPGVVHAHTTPGLLRENMCHIIQHHSIDYRRAQPTELSTEAVNVFEVTRHK